MTKLPFCRLSMGWLFASLFLLSACATPVTHHTASGKVETTIPGATSSEIAPVLVNVMVNSGYAIKNTSPYQLVFERPIDDVMAQALLGSKFNTQPVSRISYILVEAGSSLRIVADFKFVTNPGSAFESLTDANNNAQTMSWQGMLDKIRSDFMAKHAH